MIDFTFPHYFHSETTPSNKEEMLDAIENADLMPDQDCSWNDGCLVKFERLDFGNNFTDAKLNGISGKRIMCGASPACSDARPAAPAIHPA